MKAVRAIYFPAGWEAGFEPRRPREIWVYEVVGDDVRCVWEPEEVSEGRYMLLAARRAVPWTPRLAAEVREYLRRLNDVEAMYERVERLARRRKVDWRRLVGDAQLQMFTGE